MQRRHFIASGAAALASGPALAAPAAMADIPAIDTHIHIFDKRRPQGAPYVGVPEFHDGVSLPGDYRAFAEPLGIVGAIPTEASPWLEDNLWALEQCDAEPFMVGYVGDLHPEAPEFGEYLGRYHKNPLYRGIRYGNVWQYDLPAQLDNPTFIDGLKLMADADLVLDTANPRVNLLQAAVKASDKVPNLRVVIDHLPGFLPKPEEMTAYNAVLKEIHGRPNIYVKLSQLNRLSNGQHIVAQKDKLDMFLEVFGEDRVMFSVGWPGTGGTPMMKDTLQMARDYFAPRGRAVAEKFFWKNSLACFKWIKRTPAQKALV